MLDFFLVMEPTDTIESDLASLAATLPGTSQLNIPDENILEQAISMDQQISYDSSMRSSIDPIGLALAESENVTSDVDLTSGIPGFPDIVSGNIQDSKLVAESLRQILMEQSNIDLSVEQIEGLLPSLAQLLPGICQSVAASNPPPPPPPLTKIDPVKHNSNVFVQVLPNTGTSSSMPQQIPKPPVVTTAPSLSSITMNNPPPSLVHAVPIAPHPTKLTQTHAPFSASLQPKPTVRKIAPATSNVLSTSHIGGKINVKVLDTPIPSTQLSSAVQSYSKPHNILQPMEIRGQFRTNNSVLKSQVIEPDNDTEDIDVGGPVLKRGFPLPEYLKDHSYSFYNPVEAHRNMSVKGMKSYSLIPADKLSFAPVIPPTSMMLYKLLKVVPRKTLIAAPINRNVKLKIEDYQPGLKYSAKRTTSRKSLVFLKCCFLWCNI